VFEDREKLVAALSKHKADWWNLYEPICASIQRKFGELNVEAIVEASVASNTFRAFHNCSSKPSQVFREWGNEHFKDTLDKYRGAKSQREFDKWLGDIVQSLQETWPHEAGRKLGFGASLKLVNLVAKHLCICKEINSEDGKRVAWYLHVPLDRYTIVALRNCSSDVPPATWKIPSEATMSFIQKPELYWAFQYRIRELAFAAHVPPIVFDFVCWNGAHPN
jgi:hypothetical protein